MNEQARYEILSPLGEGGTAEVYLARHRESGQHVALKRLRLVPVDGSTGESLRREAHLGTNLVHPNIARCLEVYEEDDRLSLALEYVEGWDLARVLAASVATRQRPPLDAALHIARSLCLALEHAHERGVLHRDVTPSNVLLGRDGIVKLTDFGLAKAQEAPNSTTTGRLKGKLAYMSPEQASGEALDARSDLYSLAIVLFEVVTCERLFRAEDEQAMLSLVRAPRIPPPSARCAGIAMEVDELLLAALSPARAGRFPSATAMLRAIDELAHSLGVSPGPAALAAYLERLPLPPRPNLSPPTAPPPSLGSPLPPVGEAATESSLPESPPARRRGWVLLASLLAGLTLGAGLRAALHRPVPAPLQITSTPPGAAVSLDGKTRGLTPLHVQLDPGQPVKLELSKHGYRPAALLVPRHTGGTNLVHVALEPDPLPTAGAASRASLGLAALGCAARGTFRAEVGAGLGLGGSDDAGRAGLADRSTKERGAAVDVAACPALAGEFALAHRTAVHRTSLLAQPAALDPRAGAGPPAAIAAERSARSRRERPGASRPGASRPGSAGARILELSEERTTEGKKEEQEQGQAQGEPGHE
jgi:serine/threonine protein kinase